jgi:predicted ATPase
MSVGAGSKAAFARLPRLAQVADRADDEALRLQAHHAAWSTLWSTGDLVEAQRHMEAGRTLYDLERHRSHRIIYGGHDPGVCTYVVGGITEWLLGYPTKAQWNISQALALSERIAHPWSSMIATEFAALVHLHRGEPALTQSFASTAEAFRTEQRLASLFGPELLLGAAELMHGATAEATAHLREALAQDETSGTRGGPYGQRVGAQIPE